MQRMVRSLVFSAFLILVAFHGGSTDVVSSTQARIIAGQAVSQSWPWMAAIYFSQSNEACSHREGCYDQFRYTCSAVQIAPSWLLTAAHCLYIDDYQFPLRAVEVHLGKTRIDPQQPLKKIAQVLIHPQYQGAPIFEHDIALIKLAQPSELDSVERIARGQESLIMLGEPLTVLGWGRAMIDDFYYYPEFLQFTQLGFVPLEYCQEIFSPMVKVSPSQICAGGDGVKDACDGDSGGPLMIKLAGHWRLLGLVSYGEDVCALSGYPTVFTRVSYYQQWIDDSVQPPSVGAFNGLGMFLVFFILSLLSLPYKPLGS